MPGEEVRAARRSAASISRDHEAHVARLVDEVATRSGRRARWRSRAGRRAPRRRSRPAPRPRSSRAYGAGVTAKPWPNTTSGNGPAARAGGALRRSTRRRRPERRVAHHGHERPRLGLAAGRVTVRLRSTNVMIRRPTANGARGGLGLGRGAAVGAVVLEAAVVVAELTVTVGDEVGEAGEVAECVAAVAAQPPATRAHAPSAKRCPEPRRCPRLNGRRRRRSRGRRGSGSAAASGPCRRAGSRLAPAPGKR